MDNFSLNQQSPSSTSISPDIPQYNIQPPIEPQNSKKSLLWIIIFCFLFLWFITISILLISKLTAPTPKITLIKNNYDKSSDQLTLRENMYNKLSNAYGQGYRDTELAESINEWIIYPDSEDTQDSLSVFAYYLLLRFNMPETAKLFLDKLNTKDSLISKHSCEILSYRILNEKSLKNSTASLDSEYTQKCEDVKPEKSSNESNFLYGKRLFFSGYYFDAINIFTSLNLEKEPQENRLFAYSLLSDYYALIHDTKNQEQIVNSFNEAIKNQE